MNSVRIPESLSPASISPGSGRKEARREAEKAPAVETHPPRFLVLDLSSVSNVDASAARGCFLQLAKMCASRKIVVCAAGANHRMDWMMRTHDTASHFDVDEPSNDNKKILLFDDLNEALHYAEKTLVAELPSQSLQFKRFDLPSAASGDLANITLSTAFTHFLGVDPSDTAALEEYEKGGKAFHQDTKYSSGQTIFYSGENADGFFVVLSGSVVVLVEGRAVGTSNIVSGAGRQQPSQRRNFVDSSQISKVLSVGSIFGEQEGGVSFGI